MRRLFGWLAVAALAAFAIVFAPAGDVSGTSSIARLLGPFAELASELQWIRFQRALLRGDEARALRHAETAIALAPHATESWELLAGHLSHPVDQDLARQDGPEAGQRGFMGAVRDEQDGNLGGGDGLLVHQAPDEVLAKRGVGLAGDPLGSCGVPRADDDAVLAGCGPAQSQARPRVAGAANDGNGLLHSRSQALNGLLSRCRLPIPVTA